MTINDIIAIGRQIAAETAEGGNTAARVGGVIEAIGEILKNQDYMSWQPAGNFDIEEYYEKNDQVFDTETNSCYVSLQTDNVGHPVNENDESYEEGWWMKVIDGASVLSAAAAATQAAAEANQAAEAARGIVYQAVDDHLDTESLKPVANQVVTQAINNLSENLQDVEEQFATMIPLWSASNVQIKNKTTYLATTAIGFEVGKTYRITITLAHSVSANTGFYLAPNPNSATGNKWLVSVLANTTSIVKIYTPPADSNYQYLYSYNNSPAVNGDILIEEIGEIDLQEELAELNEKDKVLKTSCGSFLNLYPDLNNAVIASNNTQHGRLYKVHNGERILVECTNLEYSSRYSFVSDYPYIGMALASHGWISKPSQEIVSDVDGYLIICRTAEYPALTLYTLNNHVNYVAELDESKASRADIKFNHKLSYDASSLSVRSSATYADGVITLASGGSAKGTVNMFNDEVLITAVIKPTSNTFNIQFGQYYADSGTLFGLRTDGTTSYLDLYAGTTLKASITLPFALASGVEYMMMIKRVTLDRSYVYLDIISDNGQRYSLNQYNTSDGMLGRMWGALYCHAVSGTCEVKNINVYSPYKSGCKVAVVGHSFVEGYSIAGMRLQRFARLLQDVLGKEECGIFGQGGCKMADSLALIQNYLPQYNSQYVLCCVGTNDNSMTLSAWKTWRNNIISACNAINATPAFFTIPPDQGAYEGEWNSINAFIRTCGSLYVDMDKCFTNNGSPVAARYLYDNCHPNPATHHSIFARILQDIPDLL